MVCAQCAGAGLSVDHNMFRNRLYHTAQCVTLFQQKKDRDDKGFPPRARANYLNDCATGPNIIVRSAELKLLRIQPH